MSFFGMVSSPYGVFSRTSVLFAATSVPWMTSPLFRRITSPPAAAERRLAARKAPVIEDRLPLIAAYYSPCLQVP